MSKNSINIDGRLIGNGHLPYVVAEMSANHNGSIDKALEIITAAKSCGADAVKLQTYRPDTLTIDSDKPDFKINGGLWDGYNLYRLYEEAQTPYAWHKILFDHAREIGITVFSSPFDESAVDFLEDLNAPAYKIASFEMVDLGLVKYAAATKKPMIISTGLSSLEEIEEVVDAAKSAGCVELALLHCVSSYPAPIEQMNLLTIQDMANKLGVVTGLSDHSLGVNAAITSVALGASIIEKHFILSRQDEGPDSSFSIEPDELRNLCASVKEAFLSVGTAYYNPKPSEKANMVFRRSLYVVEDVKAGEVITDKHVKCIRPGYGLAPKFIEQVVGKIAATDLERGDALKWESLAHESV